MIILPAIDIQDGTCVRLVKGDFATSHKVAEDYRKTAAGFVAAGASWIHMVDLDGARAGEPKNADLFLDVAKNTPLKVELGGGIRSLDTVEAYLKGGISRVILGSIALKNPQIVKDAVKEYGERIAVGIDAKNGMVAVEGWLDSSSVDYLSLAKEMAAVGVQYIIYTDISRDGMLSGPNIPATKKLTLETGLDIIASGGVSCMEDLQSLYDAGISGAIIGKALYENRVDLEEAVCRFEK